MGAAAGGDPSLEADYFRELSRFSMVGLADRITCPTLALVAEGDFADTGQLDVFTDALDLPVTSHRFTAAEGAGGHRGGLGQDRLDRVVYAWITAALSTEAASAALVGGRNDSSG